MTPKFVKETLKKFYFSSSLILHLQFIQNIFQTKLFIFKKTIILSDNSFITKVQKVFFHLVAQNNPGIF